MIHTIHAFYYYKMTERRSKMEILIEKTDYESNEAGCSGWDDCSSVTYD